jgi:hypothetical protein
LTTNPAPPGYEGANINLWEDLPSPQGAGQPWLTAPPALTSQISNHAGTPQTLVWISQDANSPSWYQVATTSNYFNALTSGEPAPIMMGLAQNLSTGWNVAMTPDQQRCEGPVNPSGPVAVPSNVISDFGLSC